MNLYFAKWRLVRIAQKHAYHYDVFRYIDQGKNPQLYTKDCMEKSLANNEAVKGKIDAFKVSLH